MVFPNENTSSSSSKTTHLLKRCLTSIDGSEAPQNLTVSVLSPPNFQFLPLSVSFSGWRFANTNFKSWARKMAALHEPTWRKAGIFEAVMASTYKIHQNTDLVLGVADKWCPDTKTFVFSWGETTITLEDVMVLLGFSVSGSPVFANLDSSGEKIRAKLEKEWREMKTDKVQKIVTQLAWMERFRDSGDELEHVAFLALWLSYFVFPLRFYYLYKAMFPIAIHLSAGTRIALAPAVLAHLYADLGLLKNHIRAFSQSTSVKANLAALFKLVQVWTWERFRPLRPEPNTLLKGEPRLALWHDLIQRTRDAWRNLENSKFDSIEWRPYTKTFKDWEFPKFYPEKNMRVPVCQSLDDEFISFARFIKVSKLVGMGNVVEHYFPDRVASQFGMLQDIPCPINQNNVSHKVAAWNDYNKPIDDLTLDIPSRRAIPCVTERFCKWWRNSFPNNLVVASAAIIGDGSSLVPTGSTMNRTSKDNMKVAEVLNRLKYMKRARENNESTMGHCQTQVPSDNLAVDDCLNVAQLVGRNKKKYSDVQNSGGEASKPLGKKSRFEAYNNDSWPCQELALIRDAEDETVQPPEIEQSNEETDENGRKAGKSVVSPPETKQTCDDELGVYGSNAEKKAMIDGGRKEADCLLHGDSTLAGEQTSSVEKLCSSEAGKEADIGDDDSLIPKKIAINELPFKADNNEPSPRHKGASGAAYGGETNKASKSKILNPSDESNIHIAVGEGSRGHDLEKRKNDVGGGDVDNDSNEKRFHELNALASSIGEHIIQVGKKVAWLKERRASKQR